MANESFARIVFRIARRDVLPSTACARLAASSPTAPNTRRARLTGSPAPMRCGAVTSSDASIASGEEECIADRERIERIQERDPEQRLLDASPQRRFTGGVQGN